MPRGSAEAVQRSGASIRTLSREELTRLSADGWTLARGLVEAELAHALRRAAADLPGVRDHDPVLGAGVPLASPVEDRHRVRDDHPLFARVARARALGDSAAAALGGHGPARILADTLVVGRRGHGEPGRLLDVHQGTPFIPVDRCALTVRIALEEITVHQRHLRFFSGSHRLGLLGRVVTSEPLVVWPRLVDCPLSEPVALAAGDATVHLSDIVRGYTVNAIPTEARTYSLTYVARDALFTGMPSSLTAGYRLKEFSPLLDAAFPLADS